MSIGRKKKKQDKNKQEHKSPCVVKIIRELKQQRQRQRQRKRHLKVNIWEINSDYFVIIFSSSHPLLLTEHDANGLVEAALK